MRLPKKSNEIMTALGKIIYAELLDIYRRLEMKVHPLAWAADQLNMTAPTLWRRFHDNAWVYQEQQFLIAFTKSEKIKQAFINGYGEAQ